MINFEPKLYEPCEDGECFGPPTDENIEEYLDKHRCSIVQACRVFGIEPSIDDDLELYEPGVSVDLKERAEHLNSALDSFLKYSQIGGFDYALHNKPDFKSPYSPMESQRIIDKERSCWSHGSNDFKKAFGTFAIIEAGFDAKKAMESSDQSMRDFYDTFTGSSNRSAREKFRRVLSRQINSSK